LSGVATLTAQYVERISGTRAVLIDTRKTTPAARAEKHARSWARAQSSPALDTRAIKDTISRV